MKTEEEKLPKDQLNVRMTYAGAGAEDRFRIVRGRRQHSRQCRLILPLDGAKYKNLIGKALYMHSIILLVFKSVFTYLIQGLWGFHTFQ